MNSYYVYEVTRERLILRAAQRELRLALRYWVPGRIVSEWPLQERRS